MSDTDTVKVENRDRDIKILDPVWKTETGLQPKADATGKRKHATEFKLELGSRDDAGVTDVLAKEVKQHRESIAEVSKGNRQDLVAKEEAELAIILEYLPKQMSREEIVAAARRVMEQVEARGPGDKGKVMSQLMPQLKGSADGREVSDVVSELLAG